MKEFEWVTGGVEKVNNVPAFVQRRQQYRGFNSFMIPVTPTIQLDERELEERFIRSSGPGGQNVNKVSTAVQLRFDVRNSASLPIPVRERLERLAGHLVTGDGVIVITANRYRTQESNREDARVRLFDFIRRAAEPPVPRTPTRTPPSSRKQRLEGKRHRSATKTMRSGPTDHED